MAFSAFFNAKLTKPLLYQLVGILQRDLPTAITGVNSTLEAIKEWNLAFYRPTQFPAVSVAVKADKFINPASVQSRPQLYNIEITVAQANQDRNLVASQLFDYVLAVDQVIASLGAQVDPSKTPNFSDFYTALSVVVPFPQAATQSVINVTTTGMQTGSVLACYPTAILYSDMSRTPGPTGFEMVAVMQLAIEVDET